MAVVPPATPPIIPVGPIIATEVLPLLQVPPATALLSVLVLPWHMPVAPTIADGTPTVTVITELQPAGVV